MLAEIGRLLRAFGSGDTPNRIPSMTELIATVPVAEAEPSWKYSRDVYLHMGNASEAASAGVRSHVALYNPKGSNCIATISQMQGMTTDDTCLLRLVGSTEALAMDDDGSESFRDTRMRSGSWINRISVCRIFTDQIAALGDGVARIYPVHSDGTSYFYHFNFPLVVLPGSAFTVLPATDNVAIEWAFVWEERRYTGQEVRGVRPDIISV